MNAEVKQRMSEASSSLSVGVGGIALASFLIALLTWFPSDSIGQPLWLLGCLEVAVSFMVAYFGIRNFWRTAPSVTSSAWSVEGTELYPHVTYTTYQSFNLRGRLLNVLLYSSYAPFKVPQEYMLPLIAIRLIFSSFFLIVILNDYGKNNVSSRKYKKVVPKEIRRENRGLLFKTNLAAISSALFAIILLVTAALNVRNGGQILVDESLSNLFVLLALIPLGVNLVYTRQIATRQQILH